MLKLTDYIGLGNAEYSDTLIGLRLSTRLHIGGKAGPSYIDVLLSGVSPLALTNALELNYIKALGATEQNGTPTPSNPVDIVCNNGVLKVHNKSGLPLGYQAIEYLESSGTQYIDLGYPIDGTMSLNLKTRCLAPGFVFGGRIKANSNASSLNYEANSGLFGIRMGNTLVYNSTRWTVNTDYEIYISNGDIKINGTTVSTKEYGTYFYSGHAYLFTVNNNGVPGSLNYSINRIYYFQMLKNGVLTQNLIPCRRNSDNVLGMYDLVSDTFFTNAGEDSFIAGQDVDDIEIYTDGTQETVNITNGGTANAEMLLKVGNNQDNQELLTGNITRNVGIKVFDGTENWTKNASLNIFILDIPEKRTGKVATLCSHYVYSSESQSIISDKNYGQSNGNTNAFFRDDNYTTVDAWKQYLATQYVNGTPIIFVYPLATSTTETVTGQTLTASGNCTVTATGSLNNLELELSYKQGVTVRVREASNESLDNQVNVTIS